MISGPGQWFWRNLLGSYEPSGRETSFQLDRLQAKPHCVAQEEQGLREASRAHLLPATYLSQSFCALRAW